MKKIFISFLTAILLITLSLTPTSVKAETTWGKIELKKDMIGKVKILKNTSSYKIVNKKLKKIATLKKGKEYGVYSYAKTYGGIYKIGSNKYVKKSSSIKYYKVPKALQDELIGTGTVEGDITWQYNRYIGTKPDVGAKIFLIPIDFDPKKFKQHDLEIYSIIGSPPDNSYLYYGKTSGYGSYEISDVRTGKYLLVVSSHDTRRNPNEEVYIEDELKERLGKAYETFYQFNVGYFNNYHWKTIEVKKNGTVNYSHDFGYTYI